MVQLFGMSNEFLKLNESDLDEIVQSKLLKMMPTKLEEQKSSNSSKAQSTVKPPTKLTP